MRSYWLSYNFSISANCVGFLSFNRLGRPNVLPRTAKIAGQVMRTKRKYHKHNSGLDYCVWVRTLTFMENVAIYRAYKDEINSMMGKMSK